MKKNYLCVSGSLPNDDVNIFLPEGHNTNFGKNNLKMTATLALPTVPFLYKNSSKIKETGIDTVSSRSARAV